MKQATAYFDIGSNRTYLNRENWKNGAWAYVHITKSTYERVRYTMLG